MHTVPRPQARQRDAVPLTVAKSADRDISTSDGSPIADAKAIWKSLVFDSRFGAVLLAGKAGGPMGQVKVWRSYDSN